MTGWPHRERRWFGGHSRLDLLHGGTDARSGLDANKRIDMEARFGPVAPKFSLYFEPTGGSTRVTFRGTSRPIGPFKLVSPLMDRIGERNWVRRLHLIKAVLEGEPLDR
jgi:hypothetical protein